MNNPDVPTLICFLISVAAALILFSIVAAGLILNIRERRNKTASMVDLIIGKGTYIYFAEGVTEITIPCSTCEKKFKYPIDVEDVFNEIECIIKHDRWHRDKNNNLYCKSCAVNRRKQC